MNEESADIINRAAGGDAAALADLLEKHDPALRRDIASSLSRKWQGAIEVDDVLQVTYLEAFLRIDSLNADSGGGLFAWLRQIARNNLRDAIRALEAEKRPNPKNRVRPAAGENSVAALAGLLGAVSTTPSRVAAGDEAADWLTSALKDLPADYRLVIERYDLQGCPIEEVAKELNRTPGAVYMLRARAHDCLRDAMGTPSMFFSDPG